MILIDTTYIHSFGGKTIIEFFLKRANDLNLNYHVMIDSRLDPLFLKKNQNVNYSIVKASHRSRKQFYMRNAIKFSSIICLANVPPPLNNKLNTIIFFHNRLLLNAFSHNIFLKKKVINLIKINYIRYYNQKYYNWVVQTPFMNKLLNENLNINSDQILTYPIFKEVIEVNHAKKSLNEFVYVSSIVSHKNHKRLIKAFIDAAKNTDKEIKLHLTLNKEELHKSLFPKNLKVEFHGTLSSDNVNELYNSCEFAIYPSLVESFGLPLIEASNHGCKVVASNLPYVHEIIKPSLTFDPYSVESISDSILKAVETDNLPETKVLVENKLDNFIDFIISQDVQR
jgi:glycosyltransferase involved in cell wall biosynthesis